MGGKLKKLRPIKSADIFSTLDIPLSIIPGSLNIELCSNKEITIDGESSILQYGENIICVNTKEFPVRICGLNLSIKHLSPNAMVICGEISSIEFMI